MKNGREEGRKGEKKKGRNVCWYVCQHKDTTRPTENEMSREGAG